MLLTQQSVHARRTASFVVGLAALTVVLSGCRSGDKAAETGTGVASIAPPVASKSASTGSKESVDSRRPRVRLDSTAEEVTILYNTWAVCLKNNGTAVYSKTGQVGAEDLAAMFPKGEIKPAARKACESKLPVQPPELDKKTNPNYLDEFRDQITCMNAKGANVKALPDGEGWTYARSTGNLSPQKLDRVERDCIVEAFSPS
jgi:hypothetical protein